MEARTEAGAFAGEPRTKGIPVWDALTRLTHWGLAFGTLTALATGLALIPLALRGGQPGSEIETPMAFVILFGLLSSMLLNMIIVPALYMKFGKPATVEEEE